MLVCTSKLWGWFFNAYALVGRCYVCGTWAFFALADLELDLLAFVESGVTCGFYLRMMDEQIFTAAVRRDKSKTLTCVKPFYFTCTHCISPWLRSQST